MADVHFKGDVRLLAITAEVTLADTSPKMAPASNASMLGRLLCSTFDYRCNI
jgi:hypothetical protein